MLMRSGVSVFFHLKRTGILGRNVVIKSFNLYYVCVLIFTDEEKIFLKHSKYINHEIMI